jgi:hypothetical protein
LGIFRYLIAHAPVSSVLILFLGIFGLVSNSLSCHWLI